MRSISGYEIIEPLPSRFHYRAKAPTGEIVALQVLPAWRRSKEALARFERELELEQAAQHENVAAFIASGWEVSRDPEFVGEGSDAGEGEVFYIVREFVAGQTLADLVEKGPAPVAVAISVSIQAARGLGALHAAGVIHRNVRPENLALREDGVLKLFDFGLVKILRDEADAADVFKTTAGQVVGSIGYMAPEQLAGGSVDARTDLFALGCVLYELVTGQQAFPSKNMIDYFRVVQEDEPVRAQQLRAELPSSLCSIIDRLLQKDLSQRYSSAVDVEKDLLGSLGDPST